jgi:hypothetical protein
MVHVNDNPQAPAALSLDSGTPVVCAITSYLACGSGQAAPSAGAPQWNGARLKASDQMKQEKVSSEFPKDENIVIICVLRLI